MTETQQLKLRTLELALERHRNESVTPETVVKTAGQFYSYLCGGRVDGL